VTDRGERNAEHARWQAMEVRRRAHPSAILVLFAKPGQGAHVCQLMAKRLSEPPYACTAYAMTIRWPETITA